MSKTRRTKKGTKKTHKRVYSKVRKSGFELGSNIRHFFLGAALALMPLSLYGYIKLSPQSIKSPQVLAAKADNSAVDARLNLLEKDYESLPTATPVPSDVPKKPEKPQNPLKITASIEVQKAIAPTDISGLIERYASFYGVNKDIMTEIAKCESGFRPDAINGPYGGIYQFVSSTWASNRKAMGLDPDPNLRFNPEEAVKTAAFKMGRDGYGAWPACQAKATRLLGLSI